MEAAPHILLIEDDEVDAEAVERAFLKCGFNHWLTVAKDGKAALSILHRHLETAPPDLILLDLNLPRMSGIELLQNIRMIPDFQATPVFVLTTSEDPGDKQAALDLGVADYLVKSNIGYNLANLIDSHLSTP